MYYEIIFDLETQKLFSDVANNDPKLLKVSVIGLYERTLDENFEEVEGKFLSFWEEELDNIWPLFQKADRLIGFNSRNFDIEVLKPYSPINLNKLNHFDILEEVKKTIGRRISLDAIAKETLERKKTGDGLKAVYYWEKHDPESLSKLKKYCQEDVIITKQIYDFGLKNNKLYFIDKWNTKREIQIDFSYTKTSENLNQQGLF